MDLLTPDRARFVEVNRTRLRVWEWGDEAAPAIVCVHGAFDHGRMWDGLAPGMAELGWRVVAPDLRGHGDSGRLSSGHAWDAVGLDLALLARALGPPVGFVGHSFGGGQALYVAGTFPELVRWVVNIDGLGPPPAAFAEDDLAEAAAAGLASAEEVRQRPPRVYATQAEMAERRGRINHRLSPDWLAHLVAHGSHPAEGGFTWKVDPVFRVGHPGPFDLASLNAEHRLVECPVLVITGTEADTWNDLTADETRERLDHLRDARHTLVPAAGHYVHVEQPDAVLAAVRDFLAEVDR